MATEDAGKVWMCNRPGLEIWAGEHYATKADAVAAAVIEAAEHGCDAMVIGTRRIPDAPTPDGDDVIDMMACRMEDEGGEHASHWLSNVTAVHKAALTAAIEAVVLKWLKDTDNEPDFYLVDEDETISTPQLVDEGDPC